MPKAITLFSGGGIADLGLQAAGFEVVGAVERDEAIAAIYALNHGNHVFCDSVEKVDYSQFAGVDLIHASPPCQAYSQARSKNLPPHADGWVGLAVIKAVREANPKWVTIENVPQYAKAPVYYQIRSALWELGYWCQEKVINCCDLGVPHSSQVKITSEMSRTD